jgi:ribosome maturation factor RimP
MTVGQRVKVICPVYNRGRAVYGTIKAIDKETVWLIVDGNKKASKFHYSWIKHAI